MAFLDFFRKKKLPWETQSIDVNAAEEARKDTIRNKPLPIDPNLPIVKHDIQEIPTGIRYSVGGKSFDLTKDQYKKFQEGFRDEPVLYQLGTQLDATREIVAKMKKKAKEGAMDEIINKQNVERENIPTTEEILEQTKKPNSTITNVLNKVLPTTEEAGQGGNIIESLTPTFAGGKSGLVPLQPYLMKGAANIIDSIGGFLPDFMHIGAKKTRAVQMLEAGFSDSDRAFKEQIDLVAAGVLPYEEALRTIEQMSSLVNQLESETKGKGRANLRFWIDEGQEIMLQVQSQKAILQSRRQELIIAAQTARLNKYKSMYGLQ